MTILFSIQFLKYLFNINNLIQSNDSIRSVSFNFYIKNLFQFSQILDLEDLNEFFFESLDFLL